MVNEDSGSAGGSDETLTVDEMIADTTSEAVILHTMAAYDNLGRRMVMAQRGELTKSQVDALMALNLFGSLSMTQISNHLAVSKEQASRAIGPLVAQGLLHRNRRADNQRIVEISLTDSGKKVIDKAWHEILQTLRKHLESLTKAEQIQLIDASRQALALLYKLLDDPH